MNILMIVAYFMPEVGSAAHVYFDLAEAFVKRGHRVDVITSYPRKCNLSKNEIGKRYPLNELSNGINIHRCKHLAVRDNIMLRGIEHFLLPLHYFMTYRKLQKKFDICLMYIPPLPLYYLSRMIKIYDGTLSVLNFQDFHPQELTDVGVLDNKIMIKLMEYIEHQSYKNADYITVLSDGGVDYVLAKGGNPSKLKHIYNSCKIGGYEAYLVEKESFKISQEIGDKFLISYAGILSPFQGIDNILDVAKELITYEDIIFYIIGDGMIKEHLERRINTENLLNVKLLPLQLRDDYFNIINSSDISIVSLDERMKAPCIPGKLINLMAFGQPIIAIVPNECETAKVIMDSQAGLVVKPGNTNELRGSILYLKNNPGIRKNFGGRGKIFVNRNMNLENTVQQYEEIFEMVARFDSKHHKILSR